MKPRRRSLRPEERASVEAFSRRCAIPDRKDADAFALLTHALLTAQAILADGCSEGMQRPEVSESSVGICQQVLNTAAAHIECALAAWANGRYASSEAMARVGLETLSIALYLVADAAQRETRIASYLWSYIADARKKHDEVKRAANLKGEDEGAAALHEAALSRHRAGVAVADLLEDLFQKQGIPVPLPEWPNVWQRFKQSGVTSQYLTLYGALSSQVHSVPEDLVHALISSVDDAAWHRQKLENVGFAFEMIRYTIYLWTVAAVEVARSYGLSAAATRTRLLCKEYGITEYSVLAPP